MFEIYQLEQLLAFAECGTLSGAAERLHLSQPALSRSMQRLEHELQVPLFDRQKNKIEFNENGRMAAAYAQRIIGNCQDMINRIQAFDRSQRTILVGSCAPMPLWEIPPTLSDLYPDRTISSELRENGVLLQGLRDGVYQLIVLPYPVEEYTENPTNLQAAIADLNSESVNGAGDTQGTRVWWDRKNL